MISVILVLLYRQNANIYNVYLKLPESASIETFIENKEYYLKIYDLKQNNTETFDCVKSALIVVRTTICLHILDKDIFISKAIKTQGAWEYPLVKTFMRTLEVNKNLQVFDIGANIGQFSLFAAKLGRKVIAVEPFYDNYIRFHKSAILENTTDNIILVTNGVSDVDGQVKKLFSNSINVGGQGIQPVNFSSTDSEVLKDKYFLTTILLDDLTKILPSDFKSAIMKIDIEGHEFIAFRKASKLFSRVDIKAIFIEWMGKANLPESDLNNFFEFMYSRNYVCRNPIGFAELSRSNWKLWPGDVIWVKKDFNLVV